MARIKRAIPAGNAAQEPLHPAGTSGADGAPDSVADAQRRLLDMQASSDREALRLRELETRYRSLLAQSGDAILMFDAERRRIFEANPAACARLQVAQATLVGSPIAAIVKEGGVVALTRRLDALLAGAEPAHFTLPLVNGPVTTALATLFRQEGAPIFVLYLDASGARGKGGTRGSRESGIPDGLAAYVAASPDALVFTDRDGKILRANGAFLELVQVATERQAHGASLGRWLGRTSVDLGVLVTNLRQRGAIKLFATNLRAEHGALTEVEISAVAFEEDESPVLGFAIRDIGRRAPTDTSTRDDLPKSVGQLAELVGRMPMKEIVGNTTGLIEQMCIRAALDLTRDNRVAAAELLGLSRQSLYVKLRRYDMLSGDEEEEPD